MFDSFLQGITLCLRWDTFGMISLGLMAGMLVGALPGFTTIMAMAILLPISFFLHPLVGIPFLIGVYKGGIFGGSISAILVSIPGTGASIATTFDGPSLTKRGQARKALEMGLYSSVFGDFASDILTLLFIGPIALIALKIRPPELTAIVLVSLIIISGTGTGSLVKGLIMCFVGLFLSMIGMFHFAAVYRFSFGILSLKAGIPLIPMLIGVFAFPEILMALEKEAASYISDRIDLSKVGERLKFAEFRRCFRTILRSTGIGAALGACPGVGQVVAAFVGYASAKKASKHPETFGKGELEGIAAAEAANNAVNGPTLVPLLTLGVPGDNITAVLLGAFVAQGLRPGPRLFAEQAPLVYAILVAMILANVLFLILGYVAIPLFARIITVRKSALLPAILIFAFAGSYVFRSDPFDLKIMILFGVIGYIARKLQFDISPMVMAFILGSILESSFAQTVNLADGRLFHYLFFERPIAAGILMLIPVMAAISLVKAIRRKQMAGANTSRMKGGGL
jgi:putative tricarboxylic transport membrane protein